MYKEINTSASYARVEVFVSNVKDVPTLRSRDSKDFLRQVMWELLNQHRFLDLPRLSSPDMLERMCPPEMRADRKTLCVLIVCAPGKERSPEMRSFRDYARTFQRSNYGRTSA